MARGASRHDGGLDHNPIEGFVVSFLILTFCFGFRYMEPLYSMVCICSSNGGILGLLGSESQPFFAGHKNPAYDRCLWLVVL